jgi:hypothetical protein
MNEEGAGSMRRYLTHAILLATLSLSCIPSLQARVFFRWPGSSDIKGTITSLGGKLAYESEVTVNGGKGTLRVFSIEGGIDAVAAKLRQAFDIDKLDPAGTGMATANVDTKNGVLRVIAIDPGEAARTVVLTLEQSKEDSAASRTPPSVSTVKDLPVRPDAESVFFAEDPRSGLLVSLSEAPGDPAAIHASLAGDLEKEGWKPALPVTARGAAGPNLQVFLKDTRICCVFVTAEPGSGRSRITILHKRRGME